MHFLGCLLGFLLIIFYVAFFTGARLLWGIRNMMKQMGMWGNDATGNNKTSSNRRSSGPFTHSDSQKKTQKKVFEDNEGEYVEFEEVR